MILNIENHIVKIDFEARTVEVSQATPNMTETETLVQAVERVAQPTLNQWVPTDAEMDEMAQEMNPEPSPATRKPRALETQPRAPRALETQPRAPRALETQPRAPCRSTCCGTLNRRTRDGSCAGCRGLNAVERQVRRALATRFLVNKDPTRFNGAEEGEE
jgi:hypothetical protein